MSGKPVKKRDVTRARVIQAAIDCIYEVGFNAAHTNRIAEAAGVSWGVLQYHFGDKDGLLEAVLNHIFDQFSSTLAATAVEGEGVQQRMEHLIETVWALVSQPEYRVSLAILRNAGKDEASAIDGQVQVERWAARISALWDDLFADDLPAPEQSDVARRLMFAALRGMADEINPRGRSARALREERRALAQAITFLLQSDGLRA
ncbi:MAG: hypothetical protein Hals2KO_23420 [Halioglobus sp.]